MPRGTVLFRPDDACQGFVVVRSGTIKVSLTAANGRDALEYLHRGDRPELILLDLMMPIMDGWEFRRRQVEDPAIAQVPVVVLSALDPARGADLNGAAFLKKPLDFDRLLELVRRFCAHADC